MTIAGNTQESPRVADVVTRAAAPYEAIYERAMGRMAVLSATWQEALDGAHARTPALQAVTMPADITAIGGPDTVEAVIARAETPRWRRSLAS